MRACVRVINTAKRVAYSLMSAMLYTAKRETAEREAAKIKIENNYLKKLC